MLAVTQTNKDPMQGEVLPKSKENQRKSKIKVWPLMGFVRNFILFSLFFLSLACTKFKQTV